MPLSLYVLFVLPFQILFFPVWVVVKAVERLARR